MVERTASSRSDDAGLGDVQPDYSRLPDPVALGDTIATQNSDPPPDPTMGRDTETEFMLRHAAG
jgi:hypothetical protein